MPAIHAMVAYDRITDENRYSETIAQWLADAKERRDPATGLLPHISSLPDGRDGSVARATSQVIILRFLPDIDPAFAREQYTAFREQFATTFVGVPCVLEYPRGTIGPGDVDSGPLIFGRSLSATVFMMAIAQMYGDVDQAHAIAQAGETVGLPWTSHDPQKKQKRYMGGILPVGDIMVGYAHVARPWFDGTEHRPVEPLPISPYWRWKTHALSLCFLIPTMIACIRKRSK